MSVQAIGCGLVVVSGIVLVVVSVWEWRSNRRWRLYAKRYPRGF